MILNTPRENTTLVAIQLSKCYQNTGSIFRFKPHRTPVGLFGKQFTRTSFFFQNEDEKIIDEKMAKNDKVFCLEVSHIDAKSLKRCDFLPRKSNKVLVLTFNTNKSFQSYPSNTF